MCEFRIAEDQLFLETLSISNKPAPTLEGIRYRLQNLTYMFPRVSKQEVERRLTKLMDSFTVPDICRTSDRERSDVLDEWVAVFNGVTPERDSDGYDIYDQLALPLPYTGAILIGNDRRDIFRTQGYAFPQDYDVITQVQFESGIVVRRDDVSGIFETLRTRYLRSDYPDSSDQRQNARHYLKRHLASGFQFYGF